MRLVPRLPATTGLFVCALFSMAAPAHALSSRQLLSLSGEQNADFFGAAITGAGDLNGDGFADAVVGAPMNDDAGPNSGSASVYFGGSNPASIPGLVVTGNSGDALGSSVALAGDFNGDGYPDFVVGAPQPDFGFGSGTGRALVYYGGPNMDAVADLVLVGPSTGDLFGASVAGLGDVNGDGYSDIVVGAPGAGRAYVFFGGPGATATPALSLTGPEGPLSQFGFCVAGIGDLNHDGHPDVAVGAPEDSGHVYVFYGGPTPDPKPGLTLSGAASGDAFGTSVAGVDVNGDGAADLIVGAPQFNIGGPTGAGKAYVYFGGGSPDTTADVILRGEVLGDQFGEAVAGVSDVDGDGRGEVFVGALGNDAGGDLAGRAYLYLGGSPPDAIPDLVLTGASAIARLGGSVASVGDMTGDGIPDLSVGFTGNPAPGGVSVVDLYRFLVVSPNGGETWAAGQPVTVRWRGPDLADIAISTDAGLSWTTIATRVGGAGENSWPLLAPVAPTTDACVRVSLTGVTPAHSNSDQSDALFRIVVPVATPSAAARPQLFLKGQSMGDAFGTMVAPAGDVNGDGFPDVIIGAPANLFGGSNVGRAYVHFCGPSGSVPPDLVLNGEAVGDEYGTAVAGAGDVNGDGFADVIVGARFNDAAGQDAGRAYVYFGGPSPDGVADLVLSGEAAGDWFGSSVAGVGDINGDGFADFAVGAPQNSAGGPFAGRAYLYLGGPFPDNSPDVVVTGSSFSSLGVSLAGAGDVNGDGIADFIVGADTYNAQASPNVGQANLYFGGKPPDSIADVLLTGAAAHDFFGISVAGIGDFNGDGFDDVIVGAYRNDAGGTDAGRAYVYFGGHVPSSLPGLVLTGSEAGAGFGVSVAGAGDVNGDGYSDVIVGADGAGTATVFYGNAVHDSNPDLVLTGFGEFGHSVSGAGDTNRDGFPDLLVGGPTVGLGGQAALYDMNRFQLLSPNGGETWSVGAPRTISWLGEEPADLWLSVDGGRTYDLLKSRVGGAASNVLSIRVPHSPSKFARIKVAPSASGLRGDDESDSSFTIQTSVALLALLAAPAPKGARGVVISWRTDPGPEDLAGYRVEKASGASDDWGTLVALTDQTSMTDPGGGPGSRYRLFAVNGLGEELLLGETSLSPAAPLVAWPLPYRGGNLSIVFATAGGLGGGPGSSEVSLFNVSGRLVRNVARGQYLAGHQSVVWDGRDDHGRIVAAGLYFLRATTAGVEHTVKFVVVH